MENYKDFIQKQCIVIDNLNELYVLVLNSERKDIQSDVLWFLERNRGITLIKNDILKHENKEYKIMFKYLTEMSELEANKLLSDWTKILENKNIKTEKFFKTDRISEEFDEWLLKESFDGKSEDITWTKKDNYWRGCFYSNNEEYKILIDKQKYDTYLFKFVRKNEQGIWTYELTKGKNINNTLNILTTIRHSFDYFMTEKRPNALMFFALDDSISRKRIYDSFCIEVIRKYQLYQYREDENNIKTKHLYSINLCNFEIKKLKEVVKETMNNNYISYPIE